ncbi:MAG TPA: type VI secretion system baseplate subunit TssK [Terriglobia bacterium]|nr:type VI secretion system baseplate subunit TssK [Terriglobia bacterium]
MRRLRPVIWSKGTFLSPQYLQAQDRFFEDTLQFRVEAVSFRPWGFAQLRISQEGLAAGNFIVSSAAGLLPDGLPFNIPGSDPAPPARPLAQHLEGDRDSLEVYLAVADYRERGVNVSFSGQNSEPRYCAEVLLVRDENSGASERPVQVARKNLRLLLGEESRQGTSSMQIAVVRRTPAGTLELDTHYVPPLLDISASEYLTNAILRRLVEILAAKSSMLGGMRRQKNQSLADFTAADVANFWLLYTVNSHFPLFRHLFETRNGHPEELFSAMNDLAGALTAFSTKIQPRDLPTYNHEDLSGCFTGLDVKVRELLETTVPTNFVSLPLKLVQPSIYAAAIADDKYFTNTRMYLAINADMKEVDLIRKVPQLVKVSSSTQIEALVRQAMPGMKLNYTERPPGSFPIKLNYRYFSLNQSGSDWEAVERARNLAAYVPADFPNPQLELIILLPQAV